MPPTAITLRRFAEPVPYATALHLQREVVAARKAGRCPDTLLLLHHPPVITLGRNADPAGVTAPRDVLVRMGIPTIRSERGGQATYHGPGQVVGYPILALRERGLGVRNYVRLLEEVMLRNAQQYGINAWRSPGRPGIFCAAGKLGAVGVAVSGGVSFHGFAFNVAPDLDHFRLIVPCGLSDVSPTSLAALLPRAPTMDQVFALTVRSFGEVFDAPLEAAD